MNNKENISETFNYCYEDKFDIEDDEQRKILINTEIDEWIIDTVVYAILRYNQMDKGKPIENRKPIYIYINSPGGDVISGLGLISAIKNSITPVYTVNMALAASMAFHIFIAGHKRFAMPYSVFLCHEGQIFTFGSTSKVKEQIDFESNELGKEIKNYVIAQTKIDEQLYDKKYKTEWYFMSQTAKELGVTDCIIGTDCVMDDILPGAPEAIYAQNEG